MLVQRGFEIDAKETAPELAARMSESGAPLMAETLRGWPLNYCSESSETTRKLAMRPDALKKEEPGGIDWKRPEIEITTGCGDFAPWPGAYNHVSRADVPRLGRPMSKEGGARLPSGASPGTLLSEGMNYSFGVQRNSFVPSARQSRGGVAGPRRQILQTARDWKSGERFGDS